MKLYIANTSRQTHHFTYKLPEKMQQYGFHIRPGNQELIEHAPEVINLIIEQHAPYGFLPSHKLDKTFSGICYSIDKEVTLSDFRDGTEQKTENLENMSKEILTASALALDQTIEQAVQQTGLVDGPAEQGAELEIVGEPVNKDQDNPPSMKATIKVSRK
ncbi:hypothetical protein DVF26_21160 [Salmonella enterica subsp. enterica]|nr:hypothetical protein [Salmonella enterica subsp. enterica]